MTLTTPVHIDPPAWHIGYDDRILMLGSCFADSMAEQLGAYYFSVTANPFGTLYNPLSIAQALSLHTPPELVEWGGLWHSMMHHGTFSHPDKQQTENAVRAAIGTLQTAFAAASVVIITFGTAWVYEQDGRVVANCHKMPATDFTRRRLSAEEIVSVWQPIVEAHPTKHFLFTISPIRHIKDGLHANQLSKATLLLAVDALHGADYFPSYEIVMDELRDYRFYAEDMLHPSPAAVAYIWERFVQTYMAASTQTEMQSLHQLYLDRRHRFLHPDSAEAQQFRQRLQQQEQQLRARYPQLPL